MGCAVSNRRQPVKGNDGRAARRRMQTKILVTIMLASASLFTVKSWFENSDKRSVNSSGAALLTPVNNETVIRSKHLPGVGGNRPIIRAAITPEAQQVALNRILSGELHLVQIQVVDEELKKSLSSSSSYSFTYDGVYGTFCKVDWSVHKQDPSKYPMFKDLVAHSSLCDEEHRVHNVNLQQITKRAKELDGIDGRGAASVLELTAVVFHESRCGSTLAANLLASYDPVRHRVYSEASPPLQALQQVCGESYERCTAEHAALVLRDVVYMLSRSDDAREERVFFKLQSAGARNIAVFQKAFPQTPYLFVYRDPVQVLMSHLMTQGKRNTSPLCLRQQLSPPAVVDAIAQRHHHQNAKYLDPEQYCAIHLASITESVVESMSEFGVPVNYNQLFPTLTSRILPRLLGVSEIPVDALERMRNTADVYSKGRGDKAGTVFVSDSRAKEEAASEVVRTATAIYLQESYDKLEGMAAKHAMA